MVVLLLSVLLVFVVFVIEVLKEMYLGVLVVLFEGMDSEVEGWFDDGMVDVGVVVGVKMFVYYLLLFDEDFVVVVVDDMFVGCKSVLVW